MAAAAAGTGLMLRPRRPALQETSMPSEDSAADIIEETKLENIKLVLQRHGVYTEALLDDLAKVIT